jgi:signal transduction histidine kinase
MNQDVGTIYVFVIIAMLVSLMMGLTIVIFYSRYRFRLFRQMQQAQEATLRHRQELLQAAIESEEKERKRIGKDLHDDVGTALSQMRMYIERHLEEANNEAFIQSFGRYTKSGIDRIIANVRNISHRLSPESLDMYGFLAAVEELVDIVRESSGLTIALNHDEEDKLAGTSPPQALAIYRVLEELLTNTIKHAAADQVCITLRSEYSTLEVTYSDNGRGLQHDNTHKPGIGLKNIESRLLTIQAKFQMNSPGTTGFNMSILVPLKTFAHEPA